MIPREGQYLIHETKITVPENIETRLDVAVGIVLVVERGTFSDLVRSNQHRCRRSKNVRAAQKSTSANFSTWDDAACIWQAVTSDPNIPQPVSAHDGDSGMRFSQLDHFRDAFGKYPVIGMHDLTIFALRGNLPKRNISVWVTSNKVHVIVDANTFVPFSIALCDFKRSICAAIVDDAVLPVLVSLCQYAVNTLAQVFLSVINGRKYTD